MRRSINWRMRIEVLKSQTASGSLEKPLLRPNLIERTAMDSFWQDLRYGARTLAKNLGFTTVAVLTLALGIGVTTAIFSFVDAVLLKPLAYRDAERLVTLWDSWPRCQSCLPSPPTFIEWKTMNTVFSDVAGYTN